MAKNYNRSDYALNKYSASIVYSGADGVYELTKEAFLASDPSLTEADYEYWKRISDADYLATARRDTYESRHTVSLDELADGVLPVRKAPRTRCWRNWSQRTIRTPMKTPYGFWTLA